MHWQKLFGQSVTNSSWFIQTKKIKNKLVCNVVYLAVKVDSFVEDPFHDVDKVCDTFQDHISPSSVFGRLASQT